jgi:hypothetical protein
MFKMRAGNTLIPLVQMNFKNSFLIGIKNIKFCQEASCFLTVNKEVSVSGTGRIFAFSVIKILSFGVILYNKYRIANY